MMKFGIYLLSLQYSCKHGLVGNFAIYVDVKKVSPSHCMFLCWTWMLQSPYDPLEDVCHINIITKRTGLPCSLAKMKLASLLLKHV